MSTYSFKCQTVTCDKYLQADSESDIFKRLKEYNANWYCSEECLASNNFSQLNKGRATMKKDKQLADRKNNGKPQLSMVDMHCLVPCARVLEFGATKYSRNNWKKGMPVSKIIDSLMRHIGDLQDGKVLDDESKLAIIGHIQCNAMFLGNKNNEDDLTTEGNLYK